MTSPNVAGPEPTGRGPNPVYAIVGVRTAQASVLAILAHWTLGWPWTGPHALGLFLTPALCAYFTFAFVAPWSWGLPILTRLPARVRGGPDGVLLTFDDGPSPECTPAILDALRGADIRAVFFVLGGAADRHPALVRRIASEGHTVATHGYRHRPWVLLSPARMRAEVAETRAAVAHACPSLAPSCWVRPPHGFKSPALIWTARRAGWRLMAWDLDARDYREADPARVAARVLAGLHAGAIILLHDGPGQAVTVGALPLILEGLRARGLTVAGPPD